MNKPFRVCLLPVLLLLVFCKEFREKRKGRLQAGIEIMVVGALVCAASAIVLIPGSIKQIK